MVDAKVSPAFGRQYARRRWRDHDRLRGVVDAAFTRRDILKMEADIERVADHFIMPFIAKGGGDFVSEIARPFPLAIIAQLLGLPHAEHARFMKWGA